MEAFTRRWPALFLARLHAVIDAWLQSTIESFFPRVWTACVWRASLFSQEINYGPLAKSFDVFRTRRPTKYKAQLPRKKRRCRGVAAPQLYGTGFTRIMTALKATRIAQRDH